MKTLKVLLCGLVLAVPVFAEEAEDRQTATSLHYVSHELDTRQDKLSAGTNAALTYTNTAGNVEQRTVKSDLTGGTTDTSLPQVNAVNAGLNTKQDDITAINDHTAVTYTSTTGIIGQKGIYQTDGTYAEQSDNLIDAKTFNAALKNGLDSEFVCSEYKPGTNLCWLWEIHNPTDETMNVHGKNLFDKTVITTGYYYNANGEYTTSAEAALSDYIPVVSGADYTITTSLATGSNIGANRRINYFDQSKNWLSQDVSQQTTSTSSVTVTVPNNAKYMRISMSYTGNYAIDYDTAQIEQGSTATAYEPYVEETVNVYIPQNQ